MNVICIIGRVTRDIELRTTTTGKNVSEFSVAVNKRVKPTDGSPDAEFFRVKAWGQTAEYAANYLSKGRLVAVTGRMESRKYTANDGTNREVWEIVADNVQGLDRPRDDAQTATQSLPTPPAEDEYDPFASSEEA